MRRNVSEATKKCVAGRQHYKCANEPGSGIHGLESYVCPLWLNPDLNNKGSFDESGYEIDHIKELANGGSNDVPNLQALCKSCHSVKTKRFLHKGAKDSHNSREPYESYSKKKSRYNNVDHETTNRANQYRCSNCGKLGHNIRTCDYVKKRVYHCSNCGKAGHNSRTCSR